MLNKIILINAILVLMSCQNSKSSNESNTVPTIVQNKETVKPNNESNTAPATVQNKESFKPSSVNISDEYKEQMLELFKLYRMTQSRQSDKQVIDKIVSAIKDRQLQKTKILLLEMIKSDADILNDEFIAKPDRATLEAFAHLQNIGSNLFTTEKIDLSDYIVDESINVGENALLANFYRILIAKMSSFGYKRDFSMYNLQFNKLGLNTPEEKAILFLSAMTVIGKNYVRFSRSGCPQMIEYAQKTPFFDGKKFYEYKMPEFKDFLFKVDNSRGNVLFGQHYLSFYTNTLNPYQACQ